jgi:hypothetical protein
MLDSGASILSRMLNHEQHTRNGLGDLDDHLPSGTDAVHGRDIDANQASAHARRR